MKNLMRDNSASTSSTDSSSDAIAQDLRTYLTDGRTFSSSLGYKWLGVDAGENANKTGEAISWLGLARTGLLELQSRAKVVMPLRKGKAERSKRKDRIVEELEDIDAFMKSYKRTNDMVNFALMIEMRVEVTSASTDRHSCRYFSNLFHLQNPCCLKFLSVGLY